MTYKRCSSLILFIGFAIFLGCSKDSSKLEWKQVNSGTEAHLYGLHFVDGKYGWAVGTDGEIILSKDGGKTWESGQGTSLPKATFTEVNFSTPNNGWLVSIGKVYYTSTGGNSWNVQHQLRGTRGRPPGILDLHFVNTRDGWAVGGVDSKGTSTILKTQNGGIKWEKVRNPSDKHLWGVYFVDTEHGWTVGEMGEILRTQDGGKRWERQQSRVEQPLFAVYFVDQKHGWVVGANGLILQTVDGGLTWDRQKNPLKQALRDVAFQNATDGWAVGAEGLILHTTDGGTTWNRYDSPTPNNLQDIFLVKNSGWIVGAKGTILRRN